jgi:hypothetical protein
VNADAVPRATAEYAGEQCGGGGGREDRTPEPPSGEDATPTAPVEEPTEEFLPTESTYP